MSTDTQAPDTMTTPIMPSFDSGPTDRKLAIICSKGNLDMAYPGLILANAALGEGIETHLFFTFWGFDIINKETMGDLKFSFVGNTAMHMPGHSGGIHHMLGALPGATAAATKMMKKQIAEANISDKALDRQAAIISSMTDEERRNHTLINGSRRKRIAKGSGTAVEDVQSIEVLKGPATLLFGSGAIGGAVNVVDGRIARELPDGTLELIDGHLRASSLEGQEIPVLVLDVDGVLAAFAEELAGYEVNKKTFKVPLDWEVDAELLCGMAAARLAELV